MRARLSRIACWMSGRSPITRMPVLSSFVVVSIPAAKRNVASFTTSSTSGVAPSGYVAAASSVGTSARGSRRRSLMYSRNLSSNHTSGLCVTVSVALISPTTSLPSTLRNSVWSSSHQGSSRALPSSARQIGVARHHDNPA
jgi:hypothetical protein